MQIATAKDLDFLLASLKGDKSDLLLQAVEEAQEDIAAEIKAQDNEAKAAAQSTKEESKVDATVGSSTIIGATSSTLAEE